MKFTKNAQPASALLGKSYREKPRLAARAVNLITNKVPLSCYSQKLSLQLGYLNAAVGSFFASRFRK